MRGTLINLNHNENYKIKYGFMSSNNSKSLYVNIQTWVKPKIKNDDLDYNAIIKKLHKTIRQHLFNLDTNNVFLKNESLLDLDISTDNMKRGKRVFMDCEITLYQVNHLPKDSEILQKQILNVISEVVDNIFEKSDLFDFGKK